MKTYYAKPNEVEREWVLIDAENQVLGRVAAKAAQILKGKHKPQYTPHVDTGDFVVIINADKIRVTGTKAQTKSYYRHSGFPGGLKSETFEEAMAKHPERVIEHAVKGAEEHARPRHGQEAQGVHRRGASAHGSAASRDQDGGLNNGR